MNITLKLYGNLERFAPHKKENVLIEITSGTTITELFVHLGVSDSNVAMYVVNDAVVDPSTILRGGDMLEVCEPVGGGMPARHKKFSRQPLLREAFKE